jgi:bifunctional non-homologous end joining protein LigD
MAKKQLDEYRRKRDFDVTREPSPDVDAPPPTPDGLPRFVVQEHHARRLHWDLRLERDGVGPSWAVPKGIPPEKGVNHLAVQTEDHPLSYFDFAGEIPKGEYGGGQVHIWDKGTYECEKWTDREVKFVLHGERVQGRYVLFQTDGKNWMIRRMDAAQDPTREPLPELGSIAPMKATTSSTLPPATQDDQWAYEVKWDGYRALGFVEGGRLKLQSRNLRDVTAEFPEVRGLGDAMGSHTAVLDGELVAFDANGRPSFGAMQRRGHRTATVVYMSFDGLYADGHWVTSKPYRERRELLASLVPTPKGAAWQVPAFHVGDGDAMLAATRQQELEGLIAKKLDAPYEIGKRSRCWLKVKNWLRQEMVIGGWLPGEGGRSGTLGALLLGYHDGEGGPLRYAGRVGTGFTGAELSRLQELLEPLARDTSPFDEPPELPREVRKLGRFVEPSMVCEVMFSEWTHTGTLRQPSYKGLRDDKDGREVVRESPPDPNSA